MVNHGCFPQISCYSIEYEMRFNVVMPSKLDGLTNPENGIRDHRADINSKFRCIISTSGESINLRLHTAYRTAVLIKLI